MKRQVPFTRLRSLQRKAIKKSRRRKSIRRSRNEYKRKAGRSHRLKTPTPPIFQTPTIQKTLNVPDQFTLIDNRDEVLAFFQKCKTINSSQCDRVYFDFDDVKRISNGAVTILLSICGWLGDHGVKVSGGFPNDEEVRASFEKSGFLKYFRTRHVKKENKFSQNEILSRGLETTNPTVSAKKIREAMKTVWGQNLRNMRLQGMLIELMANTVNHAYDKQQKGWYLSVDHDDQAKKVKFCFVDNGQGILGTIKTRLKDKLQLLIRHTNDGDILREAFNGKFGSRTGLDYRGRGLPAIKKNFDSGIIKGLIVISNNVCINFEAGSCELLPTSFEGTFYYWELDQNCRNTNHGK